MKVFLCLVSSLAMVFGLYAFSFGAGPLTFEASHASVDSMISYYSKMTHLRGKAGVGNCDYKTRLKFLLENRDAAALAVMETGGYSSFSEAVAVIEKLCRKQALSVKKRNQNLTATAQRYFDSATGHLYVRNPDNTYTEYSKRGSVLRTNVPADQYRLVHGKWTHAVGENHYLMYEKSSAGEIETVAIPVTNGPLVGYNCEKLLYSFD